MADRRRNPALPAITDWLDIGTRAFRSAVALAAFTGCAVIGKALHAYVIGG